MEPDIKYAKNGDVHIAYRILGDGPRDIVLVPGTISHVELLWELPSYKYLLQRLASFARVIVFDKRGQGLSDRVADSDPRRTDRRRRRRDGRGRLAQRDRVWLVGRRPPVTDFRRHPTRPNLGPRVVRHFCVDER